MSMSEQLVSEMKREAETTRRVIERVPEEKLAWKPHSKSSSIGQLAMHLALLPRGIPDLVSELVREAPVVPLPAPASVAEITATLDRNVEYAAAKISGWSDADLQAVWTLTFKGKTMFEIPRAAVLRTILLNHTYHHRGQLTVYLRMLDVPVPSVYGPTADENVFA